MQDEGSITKRFQTLNRSESRGASIILGENSYFCPYTENKKFEAFINDLYELNFDAAKQKTEIINYVKVIESFYSDKIQHIKRQYEKRSKTMKAKSSRVTNYFHKSELEKIFTECIDITRKGIMKRRIK